MAVDYAALAQSMGGAVKQSTPGNSFGSLQWGTQPSATNPPSLAQKIVGLGGGIAKSIAQPFVSTGVSVYNAAAGIGKGVEDIAQGKGQEQASQDVLAANKPRTVLGASFNPAIPNSVIDPHSSGAAEAKGLAQVAGTGAQIASTIAPVGAAGDVAEAAGVGGKAIEGAKVGAAIGGVGGAGNAAANGQGVGGVIKGGLEGAAGGAALGGALGAVSGGIAAGKTALAESAAAPADRTSSVANDVIHSDLTPDFNPKTMAATDKVRTPDGSLAYRTTEGEGIFGKPTVTQSASENAAEQQVKESVPNYDQNRSFRSKAQAVDTAIGNEAQGLRGTLSKLDDEAPLNNDEAHQVVGNHILQNLQGDAKDAFLESGKGIEGSTERANTVNGRYGQDVRDAFSQYDGTREGLLDLRQNIDTAYKSARGKLAFGDEKLNALDDMNTNLRSALNKELDESSQNANVSSSLSKQSKLFTARDMLNDKAAKEGQSAFDRTLNKAPIVGRLGSRVAMREAASGVIKAGTAAAGLLTAGLIGDKIAKRK